MLALMGRYLVGRVVTGPPRANLARSPSTPTQPLFMFVHSVYFWLRDDLSPVGRSIFIDGMRSLATIETVEHSFIGTPAVTTREIIDRSYSYALVLGFADRAAHDAYQVHHVHDTFREQCGGSWKKIVIYDAISA
ncbi:MAG: Dabb family protein [Gemmatimonadaceae bacterium]